MKELKQIGELHKNAMFFSVYVGEGSAKINGKECKFTMDVGATNYAPIVTYGKHSFTLSWEDILTLAEKAGLFNDEEVKA